MVIQITKTGPSKYGRYAIFNCVFDNGLVIHGIASSKEDLKEGTYKDLYLYINQRDGNIRYTIFKK